MLFEVRGVSKRFGGVQALNDVSLHVDEGEILGLAGENGAGKSTLFSVMTGVVRPDTGKLFRAGRPVEFRNLSQANRAGVYRVYQDQGLMPQLPVFENVLLGQEDLFSTAGVVDRRRMIAAVRRYLDLVGAHSIDPTARAGRLKFGDRQLLGIARVIGSAELRGVDKPLILFDEPTAAMAHDELDVFFTLMRQLRERGMTIVFVSHRLREVLGMSDRVYILKDGAVVAETRPGDTSERAMHALMVGRPRNDEYYHEQLQRSQHGDVTLELDQLSGDSFEGVSLSVRSGEIVGLGGVTGSGKEALGRTVAGLLPARSGRIELRGKDITRTSIAARIRAGVGYVPLNRHDEGAILPHSVRSNMTLTSLRRLSSRLGVLARRSERRPVDETIRRLGIVTPNGELPVGRLSGGNQQKVVIGRIMLAGASLIVLDNPTRGVDAGAKHEIYGVIRRLVGEGAAVLLITEDLPELIGLSDRIAVMRDGRIESTRDARPGAKPAEDDLVAHMV